MENNEQGLKTVATVIYAPQAAGFFLGITWIVAVIMDYVKIDEIRTFWWALLWAVIGGLTALVFVGFIVLAVDAIWIIYRITKGWLYLSENRPVS